MREASEGWHAERPLMINTAGVECLAWTPKGLQARWSHDSEGVHAVWLAERRALGERDQEDLAFLECSSRYPVEEKMDTPLPGHSIIHLSVGSELLGWPTKRRRLLACALNNRTMMWVGLGTQAAIEKDFTERFHKGIMTSGNVFFQDDDASRHKEYVSLAEVQKHKLDPEKIASMDKMELLEMLLPPGGRARFDEWHERRGTVESVGGNMLVHLGQHFGHACGGTDWPAQLTRCIITSIPRDTTQWKIATAMEHLGAMGLHVFPSTTTTFPVSKLHTTLQKLGIKFQDIKTIAGNGMHLATQSAFMLYVLSNIQPRRPIAPCRLWQRGDLNWEGMEAKCLDDGLDKLLEEDYVA